MELLNLLICKELKIAFFLSKTHRFARALFLRVLVLRLDLMLETQLK